MKKAPEKVGRAIAQDIDFLKKLCSCVWHLEIEPVEFEEKWNKVISKFHLNDHEWLAYMYNIRDMWIPAYFRYLFLGGIMRTTSRSESENNFFTMFTNPHLTLIEFYMRHTQNKIDNDSKNKRPECKTPIPLEKDASELFTTTIFYEFQYELEIGCFNCGVEEMKKDNELYIFNLREGTRRRTFDVVFDPTTFDTKCFCKKLERDEGNALEECINAVDKKMLLNDLWSEIHACVSLVQNNEDDLSDLVKKLRAMRVNVPNDVHVPNEVHVPNSDKRMKSDREKSIEQSQKKKRLCKACGELGYHDSRNCPRKVK
ncbi:protein FAR-RED IMPAIRED RESPONSE 1-like [Chenopodium quinoa]|uniref:protein FAR-RED IMPAIRED RESPONSE 1-like n=1 Tax=Chenopodium quinoa TaxID=63459 RepID=UPI000B773417|nr:protein FAR-RED IMPAIRED RESPONSE 1-like [Chenopodium quinoa]